MTQINFLEKWLIIYIQFRQPQSGETLVAVKQKKNIKAPEACLPVGRSDI